jgi:hypothetical protein
LKGEYHDVNNFIERRDTSWILLVLNLVAENVIKQEEILPGAKNTKQTKPEKKTKLRESFILTE